MADSKKYNGSTWEHSLRKLTTSTDTFTTLPADIYADGNNATVGLKGNTVQNGTPTPDNPIMPQGTGERTVNLCPDTPYKTGYSINANGVETNSPQFSIYRIPAEPEMGYALSLKEPIDGTTVRVHAYKNGEWQAQLKTSPIQDLPLKFTTISNCDELRLSIATIAAPMINLGSAPLPYENFGYKIPISSANTTTNVYLGEVETTRRIKKLVLTGKESWQKTSDYTYYTEIYGYLRTRAITSMSTHYIGQTNVSDGDLIANGSCCFYYGTGPSVLYLKNITPYSTSQDFKAFLAAQYAAGTPVTVWYILNTPTTAAVNEPLMKIGEYADTLSNAASIPTTEGANSITVGTTVQPSEFTATWTGWHDASVKEWDGSQWQ